MLLPTSVAAAECQFVRGFKILRDLMGHEIVGACLENEHYTANGDALQQTTGGLLVWRKADNWTAFTDGYRTWINGPNGLVQRLNTERFEWEADGAIGKLSWIEDDPDAAATLLRLAEASPPVFWSWFERFKSKDGFPIHLIRRIRIIAEIDEESALAIVKMPFLDDIHINETVLVYLLSYLADSDKPGSLRQLLSHPKLRGGITNDLVTTATLVFIELREPESAAAIEALPWVHAGVASESPDSESSGSPEASSLAQKRLFDLAHLAIFSTQVFTITVNKAWVQDGLDALDTEAVRLLYSIDVHNEAAAIEIAGMPFLDVLDKGDTETLEAFQRMAQSDEADVLTLLSERNLGGGIADDQRGVVALLDLERQDPEIAATVTAMPWVQDGATISELAAISALQQLSSAYKPVAQALVLKRWIQDDISADEISAIEHLESIAREQVSRQDEALALAIVNMPFLDDLDVIDTAALRSLRGLQWAGDGSYFRHVLTHPGLSDGITDENRNLAAFYSVVAHLSPEHLDSLLDPQQFFLEERATVLPRAGSVALFVLHTGTGTYRTMDNLESFVHAQEDFMGEAFPNTYVGVLVAEVTPNAGGVSYGGGLISFDPGGENDVHLIAHEVAHKYYFGNSPWLTEGGAEVLRAVAVGDPLRIENVELSLCPLTNNLSEIDDIVLKPRPDDSPTMLDVDCVYVLGFGLFADLYTNLGDEAFRRSFRLLHLKARDRAHEDFCVDTERAVCLVRQAFVTDAATQVMRRLQQQSSTGGITAR